MKRRTKIAIALLILAGVGGMSAALFIGPRMRIQPNIRPHQAVFAPLPANLAPYSTPAGPPAASMPADQALAAGKVYYGYYCAFCHGAAGRGDGPVGESYTPAPADLRTAAVRGYSDAQLERAMLTGPGHEPVLEQVVWPAYRPALMAYVRQLAASQEAAASRPAP
jgi:mono/diheme cytochrome c family protein